MEHHGKYYEKKNIYIYMYIYIHTNTYIYMNNWVTAVQKKLTEHCKSIIIKIKSYST